MSEKELNVDSLVTAMKSKGKGLSELLSKFFGDIDKWADEPSVYRIQLSGIDKSLYMQLLPSPNPPENGIDTTGNRSEEVTEFDIDPNSKQAGERKKLYSEITIEYVDPETQKHSLVEKYDNVVFPDDVEKTIKEYLSKHKDEVGSDSYEKIYWIQDNTTASKQLNVKLSKITSDESIDIELVSVNCNYSPVLALEDLGYALEDPDVISMIPDDGYATLSIVPSDDSLDIDVCEESACEVDTLSKFSTIIRPLVITRYNLMSIQNNVYGSEQEIVRDKCVSLMWTLDDMMNSMSSLCIQYLGYFPNPLSFVSTEGLVNLSETIECESALNSIRTSLLELVSAVDLYYCDMPHEIQSLYDSWLITLNATIGSIRP